MTHHPMTVAVDLSMTVFEVGIADRLWRLMSGAASIGSITKRGDVYLRCLLTHGARAVLLTAQRHAAVRRPLTGLQPWAVQLAARKGHTKTTIAVANQLARIVWAVWARDAASAPPPVAASGGDSIRFSKELLSERTDDHRPTGRTGTGRGRYHAWSSRPLFSEWPPVRACP